MAFRKLYPTSKPRPAPLAFFSKPSRKDGSQPSLKPEHLATSSNIVIGIELLGRALRRQRLVRSMVLYAHRLYDVANLSQVVAH